MRTIGLILLGVLVLLGAVMIPKTIMVIFGILLVVLVIAAVARIGGRNRQGGTPGWFQEWWVSYRDLKIEQMRDKNRGFIWCVIGVVLMIINLIVYDPFRHGWATLILFLVAKIALGVAVLLSLVLIGIVRPGKEIPLRKIVAGFAISTVLFDVLYSIWESFGITAPSYVSSFVHDPSQNLDPDQKFWWFVIIAVLIVILAIGFMGKKGFNALGKTAVGLIVCILFLMTTLAVLWLKGYVAHSNSYETATVKLPDDARTVRYAVGIDPIPLRFTDVPAPWRKCRSGVVKTRGYKLEFIQSAYKPVDWQRPDLVLEPYEEGYIQFIQKLREDGTPCFRENSDTVWVRKIGEGPAEYMDTVQLPRYERGGG